MSLVEAVMSITIVVGVLSGVTITTLTVSEAQQQIQVTEQLDSQGRRALDFFGDELAAAQSSALFPQPILPFGSSDLLYRQSGGMVNGQAVWSPPRSIQLVMEDGEIDDGLDNNGNGLVDERAVLWIRDLGQLNEKQTIRVHWVRELLEGEVENGEDDNGNGLVDEPGLCFWLEDGALNMAISLETPLDEENCATQTVQKRLRINN